MMTTAATSSLEAAQPLVLPASEEDFIQAMLSLRFRFRSNYLQQLALTQGEALIPLLTQLLATEPAVLSIPIVRPVKNEAELAPDGSNPNPEVDVHPLHFPQSNSASRYLQRDTGITMAITLAHQKSRAALELLLSAINHPNQHNKKRIVQCLSTCASDEEILSVVRGSAPAVLDSLVSTLTKNKRKNLVRAIQGKPRKDIVMAEKQLPLSTRFRKALEEAKEYERQKVWDEYASILDVANQPSKNLCEEGENIKDIVLHLQETLPPLFAWDESNPELRAPKLASLIEKYLISLLHHDAERTMCILKTTSWQVRGDGKKKEKGQKVYSAHIPAGVLDNKKARNFWCRRKDQGELLQDYLLSLIDVENGVLVKNGGLPFKSFFRCCRGPVVVRLVQTALGLLTADEFKTYVAATCQERNTAIGNILGFAVAGVLNLTRRVGGCSAIEDRLDGTKYFHGALDELIAQLISTSMAAIRVQTNESAVNQRLYDAVLRPLIHSDSRNPRREQDSAALRAFPPLAQQLFDQIISLLKPKSRKEFSMQSIIEDLLDMLAPRDTSVYAIPDNKVKPPFSSIPPWSNNKVFHAGVVSCLKKTGKGMVHLDSTWINHFCKLAPYLTQSQRDEMVRLIKALPTFKTLINEYEGTVVFPMLQKLCTNLELRHEIVAPLVFCDKKDREVDLGDRISDWAAYADIRIPNVRALMVKETTKPAFEDRLKWIVAIIKATWSTGDVKEWITTLKWLIPKVRNEIQPNLVTLSPNLLPPSCLVPRQYLDDATLEQAHELSALYLAMDAQNAAAVTPVLGVTQFIDKVAREACCRFIDRPGHPFFLMGAEITWRRIVTKRGELTALDHYRLPMTEPVYSDEESERREDFEIARRQMVAKDEEYKAKEGQSWGNYLIMEGQEEEFVQAWVQIYHSRWLAVKSVMDPEVEGDDVRAFKTARPQIWRELCSSLHDALGWRWKLSPTLVSFMDEALKMLEGADTKNCGSDKVLQWDWNGTNDIPFLLQYVNRIGYSYDEDWMQENLGSHSWYRRFRESRLVSTEYQAEVSKRERECVGKEGKKDHTRYEEFILELLQKSNSAIHLPCVKGYLSTQRPDLISDEQLTMTKGIIGLFNQVDAARPWNFIVQTPSLLTPHQCELLKSRHRLGMTDTAAPFKTRVDHAQAFIGLPTTTVEDVANALAIPSLPSRIVEALLMFLPTLSEPASTLQLLLAPVYVQSSLARTAIHAVENALKCVPLSQAPDFILPLFPPVGERQQKVTVQKEGIRLACSSMRLVSDPKISGLIEELLLRPEQHLHNDVRVVILQAILGLLTGSEAKEERYQSRVEWIWRSLGLTANSDVFKKSGVATVLLAVTPTTKGQQDQPTLLTSGMSRAQSYNATLNDLAVVRIPEALVGLYVEEVLIPMCAAPTGDSRDDKDLIDIRNLALQVFIQNDGWVTTQNARGLAKDWRREASILPVEEDKAQLWRLYVLGIAQCVGKEVQEAMANGQEATVAWQELIAIVKDEVNRYLDSTQSRTMRLKAMDRITAMNLGSNFLFKNFDKAVRAGAFKGDERDLAMPLLDQRIESVTWRMALRRELAVFRPRESMTQEQINQEALRILLLIVHYSNRYHSEDHDVRSWVYQELLSKANTNSHLRRFIGHALLDPQEEMIDWIHVDEVALTILQQSKGVFTFKEIGAFVDRLANQDRPGFYWSNHTRISNVFDSEIGQLYKKHGGKLTRNMVSQAAEALTPLMARARAAGWTKGPDATIVIDVVSSQTHLMCAAFPKDIGSILHHRTAQALESCVPYPMSDQKIANLVSFGVQALRLGRGQDQTYSAAHSQYGISPATTLLMEAILGGNIADLDLTSFVAPHSLPWEAEYGRLYYFAGNSDDKTNATSRASTLKEADDLWHQSLERHGAFFKPMKQAIEAMSGEPVSPLLANKYREFAVSQLNCEPKFILMRPFVYLDYIRLALTAPESTLSIATVTSQMRYAFVPTKDDSAVGFAYNWAPPLALALDLAEYLLNEVREEAATEGEREAQLIEKLTASFLSSWTQSVVLTEAGKHLAEVEDVPALEARYQALVERLCEQGSGGQSVALQLMDFVPGGIQKAAAVMEREEGDDFEGGDDGDDSDYDFGSDDEM
ncbi:hypothetical protein BGZ72_005692 [Mortierella alpina]|nr:hypothetical protein BGZ72_005692 [Mortierella alpina]